MIVIDEHGIMQFFSSAAERQFGYTEPEGGSDIAGARTRAGGVVERGDELGLVRH